MSQQLFDLCLLEGAVKYVCCSTASSDDCPPHNLVNRSSTNGCYLAASYIRAPASLYLHLADQLTVTLASITADTRIGAQNTSVVRLFGANRSFECCSKCNRKQTTVPTKHPRLDPEAEQTSSQFYPIGKCSSVDGKVSFCNQAVCPDQNSARLKNTRREDPNVIENIKILQIELHRTDNASIPCLKNLKVLVKPNTEESRSCLESLQQTSTRPQTFNFFGGGDNLLQHEGSTSTEQPIISSPHPKIKDCEVPAEFVDEITHEIMQIPMVLPSGKIVDRSTVEKCNESQAMYGGLHRDPFSGTVYTSKLKPVFNSSLKARIDEFITDKNIQVTSGRTLGDARSIQDFLRN